MGVLNRESQKASHFWILRDTVFRFIADFRSFKFQHFGDNHEYNASQKHESTLLHTSVIHFFAEQLSYG